MFLHFAGHRVNSKEHNFERCFEFKTTHASTTGWNFFTFSSNRTTYEATNYNSPEES
jgi:hypothetical protein